MTARDALLTACRNVMQDVTVTGAFRTNAATMETVRAAIEQAEREDTNPLQENTSNGTSTDENGSSRSMA